MDTTPQDERPFDIDHITADQFKLLIDKMINGFALHKIVLDENGKPIDYIFLEVNPAFERKTGLKREDIIGKKVTEALPGTEKDPADFIGKYGAVALGGEPMNYEVYSQVIKKWFLVSVYSPQKYYFVVMLKDITEIKLNEKKLQDNEKRMRMMIDIIEFKSTNVQEFIDYALHKAIELTESKIGYIYFYNEKTKLFTLNSWSKEVMQICKIQEQQTVYELDKTGIWGEAVRQRKPIILNDFQAPNPLKKGYPEGHAPLKKYLTLPVFINTEIVAVVAVANKETDYDDNDIIQLELLMESVWKIVKSIEAETKLMKEEEKFRLYFDRSPQGIFVIDNNGIVIDINPMLTEVLGFTKPELVGQNLMSYLSQEYLEIAQKGLGEVVTNGFTQGDYDFLNKGGEKIKFSIKVTKLNENSYLGFCDDITDKAKTINQLEASNLELQRMNSLIVNRELKMVQLKNKLMEMGVDPTTI